MAKGFLIESSITATDVVAKNRYAVSSTADFDGGNLVALTAPTVQGEDRWTATVPAAGALGGLYIAYNPSMHITEVGENQYAGLSVDPRDYTNVKGETFTVFKPEVGDIFVLSAENIDTPNTVVDGDFVEAKAAQSTWTRVAKATGATAGSTAAQVMHKVVIPFPAKKGTIGFSKQTGFKVAVVQA